MRFAFATRVVPPGERPCEAVDAALAANAIHLIVPHTDAMTSAYRPRNEVRRNVLGRELRVRFRLGRFSTEQLACELARGHRLLTVRMEQRRVEAGARGRPAVLQIVGAWRAGCRCVRHKIAHERDDEPDAVERGRLVGDAHLERAEPRMGPRVPPDAV